VTGSENSEAGAGPDTSKEAFGAYIPN
jgi:hypothetical protein